MRIAMITNQLALGGAETQMAALARAVAAAGHEVRVVSLLPPCALAAELEADGVPVFATNLRRPGGVVDLIRFFNRFRPEVAHAHLFHANLAARIARLVCPIPVVISTIHSLAESSRRSADVRWRDRLYRVTDTLSDATVCVAGAVAKRHIEAKAVSAARARVIPNGVDTARFRPDAEARRGMRESLGLGDRFTWVAVGRLIWKKNYALMLDAMARAGAGVLLIAGAGPDEDRLRETASRTGVDARLLGNRADVPALLNAGDALVLSSDVEGLPMALLEAAACGLPAVATDVGGVRDIVEDGRTGFVVPPGDAAALAAAMARMAALPAEERAGMGAAARDRAAAEFELSAVVRRWVALYAELLERSRWM